jgi:hypothetical protein
LSALNHFTVPVAIDETPPLRAQERAEEAHARVRYSLR